MRPDWQVTPLGKFIKQSKKKVKVQDGVEYPAVGVMMEGRGFVTRPPFVGGVTTYKQLTPIEPNQLVLRSITAWEAPIQVTTQAQLGFHVSGVFPVFDIDSSILNPRFLSLLCRYEPFWESMRERTVGSVLRRKTLSATALMEIPIQLPPLPEQKRIVDLISSVDSYIEALQQQLGSAKTSRNAVLHELLTAGGDDWVDHKLIDMFEIYQPQTIAKSLMSDDGEFIVFGANGPIGRYNEFNHDEPEVVVTCRGATCGTVNMTPPKTWITGNAMVVSPKTSEVSKEFLYWALVAGVDIQSVISGSAQPQITREGLAPVKIKIPPLSIQKEIVDLISGFELNISNSEETLNNAKSLRSGLLSDLLSGKHEIPVGYDIAMGAA